MTSEWTPEDTRTHQDHVIAHVIGATVLGYFILDEALHVLLDIGFIWTIYLDGEMTLLPHAVAVGELEAGEELRMQIKADIDALLGDGPGAGELGYITPSPVDCVIKEIGFFRSGDRRRLVIAGEEASLAVETSLKSGQIEVCGI